MNPAANVKWIVIHYSATPVEENYTVHDIDAMHRARGFRRIGYHFFIRKDGTVETGRKIDEMGRFETGAHSEGENSQSVGICYEGGVTSVNPHTGLDTRTPAQVEAMIKLIRKLQKHYPNAIVIGHRDMPRAATQCPGFDVASWWAGVNAEKPTAPVMGFSAILQVLLAGLFPKTRTN